MALSLVALATQGAEAATSTWAAGATGNWSNAADWTGGVPNSPGALATYNTVTTPAFTTLDENITVGSITKQASGAWTISASGSNAITLDNTGASGDALIKNSSGSNALTIGTNIIIQNTDLDISSNAGVIINGNITAATAQTLNLAGTTSSAVGVSLTGSVGASGSHIAINSNGAGTGGVSISGNLGSAVTSVTQASVGSMTLAGNNSAFTGSVTITSGTLRMGSTTALSSNNVVTLNGGILDLGATSSSPFSVTIAGLNGSGGNVQNSGTNTATVTLGGSGNYVFLGTIAPPSQPTRTALNVALTGNGSQTLTGANTYTGTTTITSGILQLGNGGTTGSLAAGSAIVDNGTLTINRSNAVTQGTDFSSAAITGSGGFTQAGTGTTTLNAANTYSGTTSVTAGELDLARSAGSTIAGNLTIGNGTQAANSATAKLLANNQLATTSTVTINSDGQFALNGFSNTVAALASSGGNITSATAGGNLTVSSGPAFSASGNAIGAGATVTSSTQATLATNGGMTVNGTLADSLGLGSGSNLSGTGTVTGAVTLAGSNTIGSSGTLTTGGLSVGGSGNVVNGGTITGGATIMNGSALKVSSGALSGAIGVNSGGALTLNSGAAITGAGSTLTVAKGATLAGSGGATSLSSFNIGSGGTGTSIVQVGDGTPASSLTLTASGASTISNTNLDFNVNTAGGSSELNVGSTSLTLNGVTLALNITNPGVIAAGTPYILIAGTGGNGNGTLAGSQYAGGGLSSGGIAANGFELINGLTLNFAGAPSNWYSNSYVFLVNHGGVDDIEVEVVPEPGTWALMLGGLGMLLFWQRRNSRAK